MDAVRSFHLCLPNHVLRSFQEFGRSTIITHVLQLVALYSDAKSYTSYMAFAFVSCQYDFTQIVKDIRSVGATGEPFTVIHVWYVSCSALLEPIVYC